jgi:hypothetical protein
MPKNVYQFTRTEKKARQITISVSPESGTRFQVTLLTLQSLAMAPRYFEKFQTLGSYRHRETRAYRLCAPGKMVVVISDYIAPTADNDIDIDTFVNCNWVDTRWQYTFTHKQYIEHHN